MDTLNRGQNFPDGPQGVYRRAICKGCGAIMRDLEPCSGRGEYYHPKFEKGRRASCPNQGKTFTCRDLEVEPFLPKRERRRLKRHNQRA